MKRLPVFLVLGAVAFVALLIGLDMNAEREVEDAVANGISNTAHVESMKRGDCLVGSKTTRCLELGLKVYPPAATPYVVTVTQQISTEWLPRVQAGQWLIVAVDKTDPKKVTINEAALQFPPPEPVK